MILVQIGTWNAYNPRTIDIRTIRGKWDLSISINILIFSQDGTINYLTLPAVTEGLRFLSTYLPLLPLRLSSLLHFLTSSLSRLRHSSNSAPVVRILSRLPLKRLKTVNDQSDTGSTISLIFLDVSRSLYTPSISWLTRRQPSGVMLPNSFIEYAASSQNISLRTGCMCNPGGI